MIALTTFADDESVLGALRAGARGYLTKDASSEDIRAAILTVAAGDAAHRPRRAAPRASPRSRAIARPTTIAMRIQIQVPVQARSCPTSSPPARRRCSSLIAEGLTNAEIAERLVVSPTTVKSHINHLFTKAGLRDRAQAVNYAYRTGIATPPS